MTVRSESAQAAPQAASDPVPYGPSWIDRLTDWVEGLPGPAWAFYVAMALTWILVVHSGHWLDGSLTLGTFAWLPLAPPIWTVFPIALIHYLDREAGRALALFRPAVEVSDAEYRSLEHSLTSMPARPALLATLLGSTLGVSVILLAPDYFKAIAPIAFTSPLSTGIWLAVGILGYGPFLALAYHTFRRVRQVSFIYTKATRVNLFRLDPVYALSGLMARSAIGWTFAWYATFVLLGLAVGVSELLGTPLMTIPLGISLVVAVAAFVWPLWGIHIRMAQEKRRLQTEANSRLEAAITELHRRIDAVQLSGMGELNRAMSSLIIERDAIAKIPTWPWTAGTLRGFLSALLIPLVLFVIQRVLDRAAIF